MRAVISSRVLLSSWIDEEGDDVCSVLISRRLSEELAVLTSTHRMVVVVLSRFCAVCDPRCAIIGLSPPWHLHRLCDVLFVGAGSIWCCDRAARAAVAVAHLPLFLCADERAARCSISEPPTSRTAPSSSTLLAMEYVGTDRICVVLSRRIVEDCNPEITFLCFPVESLCEYEIYGVLLCCCETYAVN